MKETFDNSFLKELAERALENRKSFLAPYIEGFQRADKKGRAAIVIELLKMEPSHIWEKWILSEIEDWMRAETCKDWLEQAFIAQRGRYRLTEKQSMQEAKDKFLILAIDKIVDENKISKSEAFKILALAQAENPKNIYPRWNPDKDTNLEEIIKKRYKIGKKREKELKENLPPFPYLGRDVVYHGGKKFTFRFGHNGPVRVEIIPGRTKPGT